MNGNSPFAVVDENAAAPPANYDACTPGVLPASQIAIVEAVHRQFLHTWAQNLSEYLQTPVIAELGESRQTSFSQFLGDTGNEGCIITLELAPGPGKMFLALGVGLMLRTLGLLMGAPVDPAAPARTSVTAIELHILHEFFDRLILDLQAAWSACRIDFKLLGIQSPTDLEPPAEDDRMLILNSALRFADAAEPFSVALPPLMARLAAVESRDELRRSPLSVREGLRAALGRAKVEVQAVLTGSTLRMSDLLAMKPGQTVTLSQPANTPLQCLISGVPKFRGELIQSHDRAALLIERGADPQEQRVSLPTRGPA